MRSRSCRKQPDMRWGVAYGLAIGLLLAPAGDVAAQSHEASNDRNSRAVMIDTVVGVQDYFAESQSGETQTIIDTFATVEMAPRLQASFRPLLWRKTNGQWTGALEYASVRYDFKRRANWSIEAGKFSSPVGLGMTENRANVNDGTIWCHRPYYGPLPALAAGAPRHNLVAATYPLGVQVKVSGNRWDARAAVLDRSPVQRAHHGSPHANGMVGAGFSPRQGLRIGAAGAWGRSGNAETSDPYTLLNIEGEYAFGHTKVSGEWTRDVFDTQIGRRVASGWTMQARQTLTPRVFVHTRFSSIEIPPTETLAALLSPRFWSSDSTVGYLVSPEVTLRLGHTALHGWSGAKVDHQIGLSIIWSRRWW